MEEEFRVRKGWKQGGPLSPFLFTIAAVGLIRFVHRAIELGSFQGYKVGPNLHYSLLQFVDDAILLGMGKRMWENLLSINTIFRSLRWFQG